MPSDLNLGLTIEDDNLFFRVWSPYPDRMLIHIYNSAEDEAPEETFPMKKDIHDVWEITLGPEYLRKFYTYQAVISGSEKLAVTDPYAKSVGVNGTKAAIIDLKTTNPEGWEHDQHCSTSIEEAIIYEVHVRDFTVDGSSNHINKGKYLGFIEEGTKNKAGDCTGLDYLKELGVTHVQLLPIEDYQTVDESNPNDSYNWGYDPQNYNSPEGSYATDPFDPNSRVKELKTMVQALHNQGIGVIMDVVYTHTYLTENSVFQQLTPGYFYRFWDNGHFSNASGCGNEIATEKEMVKKYILDSLKFWMNEYHIDGFRFDLMAIFDTDTINYIAGELRKIYPNILLYGEGWTADRSPMPDDKRAIKYHAYQTNGVGMFCDEFRDALKGPSHAKSGGGFVTGSFNFENTVRFGIVGATHHDQISWNHVNYTNFAWADMPTKCIHFASCHDGQTLWDWLRDINGGKSVSDIKKMQQLALSMILMSNGVPLLHAGSEFLRSKMGHHNTYNLHDEFNKIDWGLRTKNLEIVNFVRETIKLRKENPIFRLPTRQDIQRHLKFLPLGYANLVAYTITGFGGSGYQNVLIIHSGNPYNIQIPIPDKWNVLLKDLNYDWNTETEVEGTFDVPRLTTAILVR